MLDPGKKPTPEELQEKENTPCRSSDQRRGSNIYMMELGKLPKHQEGWKVTYGGHTIQLRNGFKSCRRVQTADGVADVFCSVVAVDEDEVTPIFQVKPAHTVSNSCAQKGIV